MCFLVQVIFVPWLFYYYYYCYFYEVSRFCKVVILQYVYHISRILLIMQCG